MPILGVRSVSERGLEFITRWEVGGFTGYLVPYNDPSGYATIGVGHLLHKSPVTQADIAHYASYRGLDGDEKAHPFNQTDAEELLANDLAWVQHDILAYIKPKLGHDHFDALADLIFNCGPAPLTGTVGQLYNEQDFARAGDAMLTWCHGVENGQLVVIPGLLERREAEQQIILHGTY
jgi:GH24 family phage-related lysozyme (muramidase)